MVESTGFTIVPIYLDCAGVVTERRFAGSGGVSSLEDDTVVHESDSRIVTANERSDRALQSWQITLADNPGISEDDAKFLWDLFRVCRLSKGFLFVPPNEEDRVLIGQPLRNTATEAYTGDGVTTTFQLMFALEINHDIGGSSSEMDAFEVNYPLGDEFLTVYANGVEVPFAGVSEVTGVVTLSSAPANGAVMTADFERAIPVRFTSDSISRTLLEGVRSEVRSVQFKEIP
jgi:uncharacterized protein (TIGR02217 family)